MKNQQTKLQYFSQLFALLLLFFACSVHADEIRIFYKTSPGDWISVRGDGAGLTWEQGIRATEVQKGEWVIDIPEANDNFQFKPLINDKRWSTGNNYKFSPSSTRELIYPYFGVAQGQVQLLPKFHSTVLGNDRPLVVYLPPSYDENTAKTYPVVYAHDGQNVFDPKTSFLGVEWEVDERMNLLLERGIIREAIVVGVYNTSARMGEYTPVPDPKYGGGNGERYLRFLEEELIPYIHQNYRTKKGKEDTMMMGSSLGGLISFYAGWTRPETFGSVACLSSSFWWSDEYVLQFIQESSLPIKSTRFYLDAGANKDGAEQTEKIFQELKKQGYDKRNQLEHYLDPQGSHSESSWAKRVHKPLIFLLGNK